MSSKVLLVRHADHDEVGIVLSGRSSIELNAAGLRQAERLAHHLAGRRLSSIHSSPRPRARQTAEAIALRHNVEVAISDALDEIDFGTWTGRAFGSLADDPGWRRWNADRGHAATPGGETMRSVVDRALAYLRDHVSGEPILCVSHGDVIRGLVTRLSGLNDDRLFDISIDPASLTTIELDARGSRVLSVNERFA